MTINPHELHRNCLMRRMTVEGQIPTVPGSPGVVASKMGVEPKIGVGPPNHPF